MQTIAEVKRSIETLTQIEEGRGDTKRNAEKDADREAQASAIDVVEIDYTRIKPPKVQENFTCFPQGQHWAMLIKEPYDVPLWLMPNFDNPWSDDIDSPERCFFSKTGEYLSKAQPIQGNRLGVIRFNIFKNRLIAQAQVTQPLIKTTKKLEDGSSIENTEKGYAEIHSYLPLLLPSGAYPVSSALMGFYAARNRVDMHLALKLQPELAQTKEDMKQRSEEDLKQRSEEELKQQSEIAAEEKEKKETQETQAFPKWLWFYAAAADGVPNEEEYRNGRVTSVHLTGLAEFVVIEPSKECAFVIQPQNQSEENYPRSKEEITSKTTLPLFQGILSLPVQVNPNTNVNPAMHSYLHGIVKSVEGFADHRLFLNHKYAGKVWLMTMDVQGATIEVLCLRDKVSHKLHKTPEEELNPNYEDSVVAPKPGDYIFTKVGIQAFSAHDARNLPSSYKVDKTSKVPRQFKNIKQLFDYASSDLEDQPRIAWYPDEKYMLHTPHIMNEIAPATYGKTQVLCKQGGTGVPLFHFVTITQTAHRKIEVGAPKMTPALEHLLKTFQKTQKPLGSEAQEDKPKCRSESGKGNARLLYQVNLDKKEKLEVLISFYNKPFSHMLDYLTLQDLAQLTSASRGVRDSIENDARCWIKRWDELRKGAMFFPDKTAVEALPALRRWVKVAHLYGVFSKNSLIAAQIRMLMSSTAEPRRDMIRDTLTKNFNALTHPCGICNRDVSYTYHFNWLQPGDGTLASPMSCQVCVDTKIWSPKRAGLLWDIPSRDLKNSGRCWGAWYTTQDLNDLAIKFHAKLSKRSVFNTEEESVRFSAILNVLKETKEQPESVIMGLGGLLQEHHDVTQTRQLFLNRRKEVCITPELAQRYENLSPFLKSIVQCEARQTSSATPCSDIEEKTEAELQSTESKRSAEVIQQESLSSEPLPLKTGYFITYKARICYPPKEFAECQELQAAIKREEDKDKQVMEDIVMKLKTSGNEQIKALLKL